MPDNIRSGRSPAVAIVSIVVVASAFTGFAYFGRRRFHGPRSEDIESPRVDHDGTAELQSKILPLKGELRSVRMNVARLTRDPVPRPSVGSVVSGEDERPPENVSTRHHKALESIRSALSHEEFDADWKARIDTALSEAFSSSVTPGTSLDFVVCRSTVCQIRVSHDSTDTQRLLAGIIAAREPFVSAAGVYYDYDSNAPAPTTTLYLLKRGTRLPNGQ